MITHRSSAPARTAFIPFSEVMMSVAFRRGTRAAFWDSPGVWMIAIPGIRTLAMVLCTPMLLSLVAMNYHFVSDVIAGGVLGALIAMYAAHLARLKVA